MRPQHRTSLKRQRLLRPLRRAWLGVKARRGGHPSWGPILARDPAAWAAARAAAAGGPRVLIATSVGAHFASTQLESALAVALTLRGAAVELLLCDGVLPACMAAEENWYPDRSRFVGRGPSADLCRHCFGPAAASLRELGLPLHAYGDLLEDDDRTRAEEIERSLRPEELARLERDGVAFGEHALAGALRFFARGTLEGEQLGEAVLRRYLRAALLTGFAAARLLERADYRAAVFNHGIYVPQGIIGEVARSCGVPVVNWNPAYRRRTFLFSHGDSYHHTMISEPTTAWETLRWTPELDRELETYLRSRWTGTEDWIWFHERPDTDVRSVVRRLGVDPGRPCVGLLTNVFWDAQLHYRGRAFPDMREWLLQTLGYFEKRPELQLLVRIHPAEIHSPTPSRQPILAEIQRVFPQLPQNVFIIPPESSVSTYAAMSLCDSAIVYGTKTAVELAGAGVPVIVAGEAWIRGKGLTLDADTPEVYFRHLDRLPLGSRLPRAVVERARRYAYHFFFRCMIPLEFMESRRGWPPYRLRLESIEALRPGASHGLDVVCRGILEGRPFIYPAERRTGR
jgi:hypothetical protein